MQPNWRRAAYELVSCHLATPSPSDKSAGERARQVPASGRRARSWPARFMRASGPRACLRLFAATNMNYSHRAHLRPNGLRQAALMGGLVGGPDEWAAIKARRSSAGRGAAQRPARGHLRCAPLAARRRRLARQFGSIRRAALRCQRFGHRFARRPPGPARAGAPPRRCISRSLRPRRRPPNFAGATILAS